MIKCVVEPDPGKYRKKKKKNRDSSIFRLDILRGDSRIGSDI